MSIYEGTCCVKNGRIYYFPRSHIFACPECEMVLPCTTRPAAVTTAYTHAITSGHRTLLEELTSTRVDEAFVEMVRSVARKVAAP